MARKHNIETQIGIGLLKNAGLKVEPSAPVASAPTAVANIAQGKADAWERGFKIGKGLEPHAARPYAENVDGRVPHQLATVAENERSDFDAGFVAGYRSRFAGEDASGGAKL